MNDKLFLDEIIQYSTNNLKSIELVPNVDCNMPQEMYSEFNNELKSIKVSQKEHPSEFYDQ